MAKQPTKPAELIHERQPSKQRARERNKVTAGDVALGAAIRNLREARGLSQRDVANRMILPDGTYHPIVAHTHATIAEFGETRQRDSQLRKAVQRIEAAVQAPTAMVLVAIAEALGVQVTTVYETAGLARPRTSLEAAIMAETGIDGNAKARLLQDLEVLRRTSRP